MADVNSATGANTTRMANGVVTNWRMRRCAWLNQRLSQFTSSGPGAGWTCVCVCVGGGGADKGRVSHAVVDVG